jgi:hypothetical protein
VGLTARSMGVVAGALPQSGDFGDILSVAALFQSAGAGETGNFLGDVPRVAGLPHVELGPSPQPAVMGGTKLGPTPQFWEDIAETVPQSEVIGATVLGPSRPWSVWVIAALLPTFSLAHRDLKEQCHEIF